MPTATAAVTLEEGLEPLEVSTIHFGKGDKFLSRGKKEFR